MDNEYEIECEDCGWQGDTNELVSLTENFADVIFVCCPDCKSMNITDIDQEEY